MQQRARPRCVSLSPSSLRKPVRHQKLLPFSFFFSSSFVSRATSDRARAANNALNTSTYITRVLWLVVPYTDGHRQKKEEAASSFT
eukprot:scaffold6368_cov148-Skeletonema_menzelii.AAC.3